MADRKPEKATRDRSWWETRIRRRESITNIKRKKGSSRIMCRAHTVIGRRESEPSPTIST